MDGAPLSERHRGNVVRIDVDGVLKNLPLNQQQL